MAGKRAWYEIKAQADDEAEVWIYDEIGGGGGMFSDPGISAKDFVTELAAIKASSIALHINSPGGSVFDGQAIYNALQRHPASVTTYVDGLAASIASVVALAADKVVMAANSLFMIHNPTGMTMGTAEDMRKMGDVLDKVQGTIAGVYVEKTGLPEDEISAAMNNETWYSADEAKALGYADEVGNAVDLAACASFDLTVYHHAPAQLLEVLDATTPFADLPINADRAAPFGRGNTEPDVRTWASSDGSGDKDTIDWAKYEQAFFWVDPADPKSFGSYKLIFAGVSAGKLDARVGGIHLAAAVMDGARGGVTIPEADRQGVKDHIKRYYDKLKETVPWEQKGGGDMAAPLNVGRTINAANEQKLKDAAKLINDVLSSIGGSSSSSDEITPPAAAEAAGVPSAEDTAKAQSRTLIPAHLRKSYPQRKESS
jgi:ATP-dependent Clp endopeptidase proteolytic subunit ClpP